MQQLTPIPRGARGAHGLHCPGTARNQLHGAAPSPATTPRDKAVTAGLKPGMALCFAKRCWQSLAHHALRPKARAPHVRLGRDKPAPSPRARTYNAADPATANSPLGMQLRWGGDCPSYWEQAWGEGESPPESLYANQSTTPEGRAISAFLLQASAMDTGITNHPSFCRQTSKYKLFQARIRQQALFFNVLAENRTGL